MSCEPSAFTPDLDRALDFHSLKKLISVQMIGGRGREMEGFKEQVKSASKKGAPATAALLFSRDCDCRDGKAVEAMVREINTSLGSPDVVVHIADDVASGALADLSHDQVRERWEDAILPLPYLARSVMRSMLLKSAGAIMLVQSAVSRGRWRHATLLMTAGWGLRGLLGALSADLAGTGIRAQEVVLPYVQEGHTAPTEDMRARDAAVVVSALESRAAVTFAGRSHTGGVHPGMYPVLLHLAAISLSRVLQR